MYNFTLSFVAFLSLFFPALVPNSEVFDNSLQSVEMMDSDLIITEIMYNPNGSDSDWEWIEIYNKGSVPIDLSGYVLDDNSSTQLGTSNILTGILAPQQSAVLFDADGVTEEQFRDVWNNVNRIAVTNWPTLGNGSGDSIGIWESFENYENDNQTHLKALEHVVYKNDEDGWPNDDGKSSIFLIALELDNTNGENWALSTDGLETPLNTAYTSMELHGNSGSDIGSPGSTEIEDTTPPDVECPETIEINSDMGLCSSAVPLLLPNATDNVSEELVATGIRSDVLGLEDLFPVGITTITWTVMDEAGNTSAPCEQVVRVIDEEQPIAIGQSIVVELDENGVATIDPKQLDNVETPSSDNCEISAYMASQTAFTCADLNEPLQVDFSVMDVNGNASGVTMVEVTVVDRIKPILVCSDDIMMISLDGNPIDLLPLLEPTVSDNCDVNPAIRVSRDDEAQFSEPYPIGTTTLIWQATDASGNTEECTQKVIVTISEEVTPITFEVKGNTDDFTTELEVGDAYVIGEISNIQSDNVTASLISGQELVDTSIPGGPYLVTYEVSDGRNTSFIVETVSVSEPAPLALSITSFTLINADTNEALFQLEHNMVVNTTELPTFNLNIVANTTADVNSVVLELSGSDSASKTENVPPFALYGDFPAANYFGSIFDHGHYTIAAQGYSESNLGGEMGALTELNFSIIDLCSGFELYAEEVSDPTFCEGNNGSIQVNFGGGVEPIVYSWVHDTEISGGLATGLESGSYTVTATDVHNCSAELTVELEYPELPEVTLNAFPEVFDNAEAFELSGGLPEGGVFSGEGVVEGFFDPAFGVDTYEITYTYTDLETGCTNAVMETITVLPAVLKVQSFTLVNADTNEDIMPLAEGDLIEMTLLPTLNLDIRANTTEDVESVRMSLDGAMATTKTENVSPFALYGDFPAGIYNGNEFGIGSYTVAADPYAEDGLGGEKGTSLSVSFELVDGLSMATAQVNPLIVSPNPASMETSINFKKPVKLITMNVFDIHGRLVYSFETSYNKFANNYTLDVQDLAPGNYFIKSQDADGKVYQKQLVVKR